MSSHAWLPSLGLLLALVASKPCAGAPIGLAHEPKGFGLGIILGEPTGVTAAWRGSGPSTFDLGLAWSVPEEKFHIHADYLFTYLRFRDPNAPVVEFPLYIGVGPRLHLGGAYVGAETSVIGLRAPLGIAVGGTHVPVEGFLELVPVLGLYPSTRMDFDAAVGVRLFLSSRLERVPRQEPAPEPTLEPTPEPAPEPAPAPAPPTS